MARKREESHGNIRTDPNGTKQVTVVLEEDEHLGVVLLVYA